MKYSLSKILFLLPVILLTGCGAKVKSYAYDQEKNSKYSSKGFTYSLPKTLLEAKTTVSVYRQLFWDSATEKVVRVAYIGVYEAPFAIIPKGVADPDMRFRVDPKSLRNWRVHTKKVEFKIGEDNCIQSINANFDDKTAEILENTGKTAINVGKLVAMAGAAAAGKPGLLEKITSFEMMDTFDPEVDNKGKNLFGSLSAKLQSEVAANVAKDLDPVNTPVTIIGFQPSLSLTFPTRPTQSDCKSDSKYTPYTRIKSSEISDELGSKKVGKAVLRFLTFENLGKNYIEGIVTRIPAYGEARLTFSPFFIGDHSMIDDSIKSEVTSFVKNLRFEDKCKLKARMLFGAKNEAPEKKELDEVLLSILNSDPYETKKILIAADVFKDTNGSLKEFLTSIPEPSLITVPVSQFGRLGVIPVNSNTFVDTTRVVELNSNSGSVSRFEHQSTSSGKRFTEALHNISESAVQGFPSIFSGGKSSGNAN